MEYNNGTRPIKNSQQVVTLDNAFNVRTYPTNLNTYQSKMFLRYQHTCAFKLGRERNGDRGFTFRLVSYQTEMTYERRSPKSQLIGCRKLDLSSAFPRCWISRLNERPKTTSSFWKWNRAIWLGQKSPSQIEFRS